MSVRGQALFIDDLISHTKKQVTKSSAVAKSGFRGALNQPSKDHEEVEGEATPSGRSEHTRRRTEQLISLLEPEAQGLKGQAHMSCELESQTWKNRYRISSKFSLALRA